MSGISEERLAQFEKEFVEYDAHNLVELIAEILGLEAIEECAWKGCDFGCDVIQTEAEKVGAIQEAPEGYDPTIHGESDICSPGDRWYEFMPAVFAAKLSLEKDQ